MHHLQEMTLNRLQRESDVQAGILLNGILYLFIPYLGIGLSEARQLDRKVRNKT